MTLVDKGAKGSSDPHDPRDPRDPTEFDQQSIFADKTPKLYNDLRDRAAYVYATGAYPTHLRTFFTALLRTITSYHREPVSLDGRVGNMKLDEKAIREMDLESHPLVKKVREYVGKGFRIQTMRSNDITARRPYSKVYLFREDHGIMTEQVTVQVDGSIKDYWD